MQVLTLNCHPSTPCALVSRFEAEAERLSWDGLRLRYVIRGDLSGLRFPDPTEPGRSDELWRHTCCEAFLREHGQAGYCEFNFAPSTAWALYRFSGYREGMAAIAIPDPPRIAPRFTASSFDLEIRLDLKSLALSDRKLDLALSAVVETLEGSLSYWALRHPLGRPDFHHPDAFTLELAAPVVRYES
jgi:hypothetical protein